MISSRLEVVDFESLRGELLDIKNDFGVYGEVISRGDENGEGSTVKVESLSGSGLGLEDGEIGDVEKCAEKGSERKLGDLGCLIEEQLGKVSLDGVTNVASVNCKNSGGEVLVGDDGAESTKMATASCDSVKSDGEVVGVGENENKVDGSNRLAREIEIPIRKRRREIV